MATDAVQGLVPPRGSATIKWGYAVSSVMTPPRTWGEARGRVRMDGGAPRANDVVVAEVLEIRAHTRIDLPGFDRSTLFPGDLVGMAVGPRYATRHFHAVTPPTLDDLHFVAPGGVCGRVVAVPDHLDEPTRLRALGYLVDAEGRRINLRDCVTPDLGSRAEDVAVICVVGSAMDAGKTTCVASLVNGLTRGGRRIAAAKVTGTASSKDINLFRDAGAVEALDFTCAGFAVTAGISRAELWSIVEVVLSHLSRAMPDGIVLEIADGITQRETQLLLESFAEAGFLLGIMYACKDALGVGAGVMRLRSLGLPVLAVSGTVTVTPLSIEEAQAETDAPVLSRAELCDPGIAERLGLRFGAKRDVMAS